MARFFSFCFLYHHYAESGQRQIIYQDIISAVPEKPPYAVISCGHIAWIIGLMPMIPPKRFCPAAASISAAVKMPAMGTTDK
jgi:hypothetical protein